MKHLILSIGLLSGLAFADSTPKYSYFTPCQNWQYDSTGGYKCQWLGSQINVYDTYEIDRFVDKVNQTFDSMQRKIDELERRVQELETK